MEDSKKELNMEEIQDVSGGSGVSCHHIRLSEYCGEKKVQNGKTLYLWKCDHCKRFVWDPRDPNASVGVIGDW